MADFDQQFYDAVAAEMEAKSLKPGLWARAMAEAGDDGSRARALYIRMRVADLKEVATRVQPVAPVDPPPLTAIASAVAAEAAHIVHPEKAPAIRPLIVLRDVAGISVLVYFCRLAANTYVFTNDSDQAPRAWAGFAAVLLGFVISGCLVRDHRWKHLWLVAVGASVVGVVAIEVQGLQIPSCVRQVQQK